MGMSVSRKQSQPETGELTRPGVDAGTGAGRVTRRGFLRGLGVLGVAAAGGGLLAACDGDGEQPAGQAGATGTPDVASDVLNIRTPIEFSSFDPTALPSNADDAVLTCITEGLVTYRPGTTEVVNQLAQSINSSDDGLTHEFRLKEGIPFHGDFGEVTAEDVKYSFERTAGINDAPGAEASSYKDDWATLDRVEVTGTYTGVIHLSEPYAALFTTTLPVHPGTVLPREAIEQRGEDFANDPVGSGPYELVRWDRGQELVLRRFEDWGEASSGFADAPQFEELHFFPITEANSANVALETGEVDFGLVSTSSADRFRNNDAFEVTSQQTYDYGWVGFNVTDDVLSDVQVRRGIRAAIDTDSILTAAFNEEHAPANALIAPNMPLGVWEDAPERPQDLEEARRLLDGAGIGDGLTLSFSIVGDEPGAQTVAEIVQANLEQVGVTVEIQQMEREAFRQDSNINNLQLFYYYFSNQADPKWATVWFTNDYIDTGEGSVSWNFMSWDNDEYNRLHDQAISELDPERRSQMYVRMQELMDEDCVAKWVMYATKNYGHPPELEASLNTPRYGKYEAWDFGAA